MNLTMAAGEMDVVFCRNVIIYFDHGSRVSVKAMFDHIPGKLS